MGCTHGRVKSVNCEVFCLLCGEKLPADWLTGKTTPAPAEAAKATENGQKTQGKRTSRKGAK